MSPFTNSFLFLSIPSTLSIPPHFSWSFYILHRLLLSLLCALHHLSLPLSPSPSAALSLSLCSLSPLPRLFLSLSTSLSLSLSLSLSFACPLFFLHSFLC